MELNEIINPYFSFPVVGVVILAILVYAFGFKSPVQPSFDFDADRKSNKKRKLNKKLNNGSVPVAVPTSSIVKSSQDAKVSKPASPKAHSKTSHAANSTNNSSSKVEVEAKVALSRAKTNVEKKGETAKKEKIVKNNAEAVKQEKKVVEKKNEEGEWVQLLSRKEKKNRKREDTVEDIKDSLISGFKENTNEKKHAQSITPSNSKENSPTKKKTNNTAKKNDINKSKVMKVKLDDNIEINAEVKHDEKPLAKISSNTEKKANNKPPKVVKSENKPEDVLILKEKKEKQVKNKPTAAKKENKQEDLLILADKEEKKVNNKTKTAKTENKPVVSGSVKEAAPPKQNAVKTQEIQAPIKPKATVKVTKTEPVAAPVVVDVKPQPEKIIQAPVGKIVFDEMPDKLEDAKTQKKKKKTRRDQ